MLRLLTCSVCNRGGLDFEANTSDYYYCPKCTSLPNDIHVCKSCHIAGQTTCPKCGAELKFHDGQKNRDLQASGVRF